MQTRRSIGLAILGAIGLATSADARGSRSGGSYSGPRIYGGTGSNSSSHSRSGYVNRQGTYVAPHRATNPNSTRRDNYDARGNYNPYNGRTGNRLVDR
jgi:hypothetical protein